MTAEIDISPLKELRRKVVGVFSDPQTNDADTVEWLRLFLKQGEEILHPHEQAIAGLEKMIRVEYNRFGTGVSGQRVIEWAHLQGITLPHNEHWWFIRERQAEYDMQKERPTEVDLKENPPLTAKIDGIPNSWGIPRITNGILVYIERPDGTLFQGHRDNLVWDKRAKDVDLYDENGVLKPKPKVKAAEKPSSQCLSIAEKILSEDTLEAFAFKYEELLKKDFPIINGTKEEVAFLVKEWMDEVVRNVSI